MKRESFSKIPEFVSNPAVRIAASAVALGGSFAACGGDDAGDVNTGFTPDSAHTLTVEPTSTNTPIPEPTLTPTPEPTSTPTPTPEKKVEVPCVIVPQEYCDDAQLIDWEYQGQVYKMVGFKLPPGVPIFAPTSGQIGTAKAGDPWKGNFAQLKKDFSDPRSPSYVFIGDIHLETTSSQKVDNGQVIATTQDTGAISWGDYNFLFRVNTLRPDGKGFESDMEVLRTLFPTIADGEPSRRVEQLTPIQLVNISVYSDSK